MSSDIYDILLDRPGSHLLWETLTKSEEEAMRQQLAEPEIMPCDFDQTFEGWLARIGMWGQIIIYHKDPENFWGKRKVTQYQFIKRITDDNLNKIFGMWSHKKNNITKVTFFRDYIGKNDKRYTEKFIIEVKLKKALR